jgi:hypothetical protein
MVKIPYQTNSLEYTSYILRIGLSYVLPPNMLILHTFFCLLHHYECNYCNKDVSVPPGAFVDMFKSLGDNPVVEVNCDHEGLFTNPEEYTKGLLKCIRI